VSEIDEEELAENQLGFEDISHLECERIVLLPLDGRAEKLLRELAEATLRADAGGFHYRLRELGRIPDGRLFSMESADVAVFRLPCGYLVSFPFWANGEMHYTDQIFVRTERDVAVIALRKLADSYRDLYSQAGEVIRAIHRNRIAVWVK